MFDQTLSFEVNQGERTSKKLKAAPPNKIPLPHCNIKPYLKAARQEATWTGAVVTQHYFSKNLDVKPHT